VSAAAAPGAVGSGSPELAEGDEHRRGGHGGVGALIAMSLKDLDLSADQRAAVDKVKTDLAAKMDPARAAGKDLANVLADGVAAGSIDRAKVTPAIDHLVALVQDQQDASLDALNQLHAILTPAQRTSLSDGLLAHFGKWKEAQGRDDQDDGRNHSGHLVAIARELGITPDQAKQIKTSFHDLMKASPLEPEPPHVQEHLQLLAAAFKTDAFDAKTLKSGPSASASMVRWGTTRRERFLEAAVPVLTADQRTRLAQIIRAKAS
jgi:Spy/CpxP family protein refolding chaperone